MHYASLIDSQVILHIHGVWLISEKERKASNPYIYTNRSHLIFAYLPTPGTYLNE